MDTTATELTAITWLNFTGDITLVWDDQNKEKLLALVEKKMKEGYSFFTTKQMGILPFKRKTKVTPNTLETIENLIISDDEFDRMCGDINDDDLEEHIRSCHADFGKHKAGNGKDFIAEKRCKKPSDVLGREVIAARPIQGG